MMRSRIDLRQQIADLYNLVYPEYVLKNDEVYMQNHAENWPQRKTLVEADNIDEELFQLVNGTIESYFSFTSETSLPEHLQ